MTDEYSSLILDTDFSREAHRLIPGGAHTYSKGDDQLPVSAPAAFVRGKGSRVWDLEGQCFVDWGMGIQSVLVGHAEDEIDDAAVEALRHGQNFSRPTPLEVELSRRLTSLFPGMDMAKFAKNGSDANTAALRLARAVTGRPKVAFDATAPFFAIHDWFIGTTMMKAGVPDEESQFTCPFRYNDLSSVEHAFASNPGQIAAVLLEPCREARPVPGFLEGVRKLCSDHGAVLICDEVITGFRYGLHGASSLFGITPDLLTLGKGLANGYSLSALLGRRELMERGGLNHPFERVFLLSTTNGAEQSALAAALATLSFFETNGVSAQIATIGNKLIEGLNSSARSHGIEKFVGDRSEFPCRPTPVFRDASGAPSLEFRTLFLQELLARKVFMPWVCPSFRHTASEIDQTLDAMDRACAIYAEAMNSGGVERFLQGRAVKPVFRRFN